MNRVPSNIQIKWKEESSSINSEEDCENNEKSSERNPLEIPVWTVVQDLSAQNKYKHPKKYIKFEEEYEIPEYELDEEDENFIQKHLKSKHQTFNLSEDALERILDFLEKESFLAREFSKIIRLKERNKFPCCVCLIKDRRNPDGSISNSAMGQCLGCKILCHAACQGRQTLENWICERCANVKQKQEGKKNTKLFQERCLNALENMKCGICNETEGAMTQRPDGTWVHNKCSTWIPGYSFQDVKRKKRHFPYKCCICEKSDHLIRCSMDSCVQYFHGNCAQKSRYYMNSNYPEGYPICYCQYHSEITKNQITESFLAKSLSVVDVGSFITAETHKIFETRQLITIPHNVFKLICDYWKRKRLASDYGRKPLIPRLAVELTRPKSFEQEEKEKKTLLARSRWEVIKNSFSEEKEVDVLEDMVIESLLVEGSSPLADTSRSTLARNYFIESQLSQIDTNFRITRRRLKESLGADEGAG
jgi:hypothetical protein